MAQEPGAWRQCLVTIPQWVCRAGDPRLSRCGMAAYTQEASTGPGGSPCLPPYLPQNSVVWLPARNDSSAPRGHPPRNSPLRWGGIGNARVKVLPAPNSDSTFTVPPNMLCVISRTTPSPIPEPEPGAFVVNPASKIRPKCSGAIPTPRSGTVRVSVSPTRFSVTRQHYSQHRSGDESGPTAELAAGPVVRVMERKGFEPSTPWLQSRSGTERVTTQ